jgi:hypothetical protein
MKNDTVLYIFKTKAKADECEVALTGMNPPYVIDTRIETRQAFVAAYVKNDYAPGGPRDWTQLERGNPTVFVVVASR